MILLVRAQAIHGLVCDGALALPKKRRCDKEHQQKPPPCGAIREEMLGCIEDPKDDVVMHWRHGIEIIFSQAQHDNHE